MKAFDTCVLNTEITPECCDNVLEKGLECILYSLQNKRRKIWKVLTEKGEHLIKQKYLDVVLLREDKVKFI